MRVRTMLFGGPKDGATVLLEPLCSTIEFPVWDGFRVSGHSVYRRERLVHPSIAPRGFVETWDVYVHESSSLPEPEVAMARLAAAGIEPHNREFLR